jgi:signal transduction histidine kinase
MACGAGLSARRKGGKAGGVPSSRRRPPKSEGSQVQDLETRLAESLEREKAKARALTEALDQQTATSEILRVISQAPGDLQPVLTAVAQNAARLCDARDVGIVRLDGGSLRMVAGTGVFSEMLAPDYNVQDIPATRASVTGRAITERMTIHVHDLAEESEAEYPHGRALQKRYGHRTMLATPLLREGLAIGAISICRFEVRPFSESQIALLKTFADQGVIAIENVRLFTETKEALERQTATSEILRVISSSPTDVQPVFDAIAESAVRLCDAMFGGIFRVDGDNLRAVGRHGPIAVQGLVMPIKPGTVAGRTVLERRAVHVTDLQADAAGFPEGSVIAKELGHRTTLGVPLLREETALGAIVVRRAEARRFTDKQIALLQTFADQAVIAIENVRLFTESQEKNRALSESLEQQTATADILRVISSSPTNVQPVFQSIAESAVRLSGGLFGSVYRFDGELIHMVAHHNYPPAALEFSERIFPMRPSRQVFTGRAILDRAVVNVGDVSQDQELTLILDIAGRVGFQSVLSVPLMRDGSPVGAITVWRSTVGLFSDEHIALLQTFADQAVIAIENVRLFKELEASNKDLREALDTQTATSDILSVISRSQTDVQPVFDAILASAVRLLGANSGGLTRVAGDKIILAAITSTDPAGDAAAKAAFPLPLHSEGVHAPAIRSRAPVNRAHAQTDPRLREVTRELARVRGEQSLVTVPLLRDEEPLGAITVTRREAGGFTDDEITLLQTFANQAVIAIENVRLFKELQGANRELSAASQHKSEFLANMSHELRTPLNAIIGFSEVLTDRMFGELNEKQEEYLKDIYASGTHLLSLINDILDLSKIEAGRMELELTDFDLPTALDNALMLVRERAQRRSLTLDKDVDAGVGQIQGDERKIRQVVLNLLSNAIKFTPEGGRIELAAVPKDGCVEVSVTDTGVGIAPEDQEKVFEEFWQVGTAEKKAEGTGLGLTLCRKFIELHGGRIWVKSQLGTGSTFTFTIPVRHGE